MFIVFYTLFEHSKLNLGKFTFKVIAGKFLGLWCLKEVLRPTWTRSGP